MSAIGMEREKKLNERRENFFFSLALRSVVQGEREREKEDLN